MFADTLTFTVNGVAKVLNRINQDKYSSEYYLRGTVDEFRANIRHTSYVDKRGKKVDRHNVEFIQTVFPVSPAVVGISRKAYVVLENESTDLALDAMYHDKALVGFLIDANITKLINYES